MKFRRTLGATAVALLAGCMTGCADDAANDGGGGAPASEGGTVAVQISGEELGVSGFRFPTGSEVTLVDGWEIEFEHVLVGIGRVWLSEAPDTSPGDQSATGPTVASRTGPWVIDLAVDGSVPAAGGEGTAVPLFNFESQNENEDAPFVAGERYAFSYSFAPPTDEAEFVNDPGNATDALATMREAGYTVLYVGVARFVGTECTSSDDSYDFSKLPETVRFSLGFRTPTQNLNCQNENNDGDAFPGEEFQRGVAIVANQAAVAQLTVHLDHPFYSDVEHEPTLYFDQFAALLVGRSDAVLETSDLESVDPTGFEDAEGQPLPWRRCDGGELPEAAQRSFDTGSIPVGDDVSATEGFRSYLDYVNYVQSSQGHLNGGEGLCYADRDYPSPQ